MFGHILLSVASIARLQASERTQSAQLQMDCHCPNSAVANVARSSAVSLVDLEYFRRFLFQRMALLQV